VAVSDVMRSPLLGLGPDTFGQRYIEPTCACPAHIPNQLSATLYESGFVGLLSLIAAIGWVIVRAWRIRLYAYVAAVAALIVGFQFTDALRFGATWVLIGAMIGLIVRHRAETEPGAQLPHGTR
jgi:O-antigen ligase